MQRILSDQNYRGWNDGNRDNTKIKTKLETEEDGKLDDMIRVLSLEKKWVSLWDDTIVDGSILRPWASS